MKDSINKVMSFSETELVCEMSDGTVVKRVGGSLSWRHNNPGNLIFTEFTKECGALQAGLRRLSIFPNFFMGDTAHRILLFSGVRPYINMTIEAAIAKYAPAYDGNDPVKYADFIAHQIGVKKDVVLKDLTEVQKSLMIASMQRYEGFKVGQIIKV